MVAHSMRPHRQRRTPKPRWIRQATAFHLKRRQAWRDVTFVPQLNLLTTSGALFTTSGSMAFGAALSMSWWEVIGGTGMFLTVPGFLLGCFLFPIPDQSVASTRGPRRLQRLESDELDSLSRQELLAYRNNFGLKEGRDSYEAMDACRALRRRQQKARMVARALGLTYRDVEEPSIDELQEYFRAHHRHAALKKRWLAYELDPVLQAQMPAMTDPSNPVTASMIRSMKAADLAAQNPGDAAAYMAAINNFEEALMDAELQARERDSQVSDREVFDGVSDVG